MKRRKLKHECQGTAQSRTATAKVNLSGARKREANFTVALMYTTTGSESATQTGVQKTCKYKIIGEMSRNPIKKSQ